MPVILSVRRVFLLCLRRNLRFAQVGAPVAAAMSEAKNPFQFALWRSELIVTADGRFMPRSGARRLMPTGSTLLVGKKESGRMIKISFSP